LIQVQKDLKSSGNTAEDILWHNLKNNQLEDREFYKQYSIGNSTLDFYCPSERLAIQLDGAPHFSEKGKLSNY
jgi:very-short-patch-repair endonuclease